MNGEYKEKLPFGFGELIVTKEKYFIQFYFSGPDSRYNGDLLRIEQNQIDNYIDAFFQNWKRYNEISEMKSILGDKFTTQGLLDMNINIGNYINGVCIYKYHNPIKTEDEINKIVESFKWAKEKGPLVMSLLSSL